jgi:alanine racemase
MRQFDEAVDVARGAGVDPPWRLRANSAATLSLPESHHNMVRPGIAVYGLSPMARTEGRYGLRPAMTLRGPVALVKRVPAGHGVSYGHEYHTTEPTTLVLVPLGYADGVPRHAGGRGPIRVGGRTYPIAGRVCMDQVVLDVGDAEVRRGDVATLFGPGDDGEPTANDWADVVGTINYEIVTRVGTARVPRVYAGTAGVDR